MNDPKVKLDAASILAKAKAATDPTPAPESSPETTSAPVEAAPAQPVVQASVQAVKDTAAYQQYNSSRTSTCLITNSGKRINFTNYQYYTKDSEIIEYLDSEIKAGLKGFTKGKLLSADELNPEAAKKREIIEEFKASQEGREFGNTKDKSERSTALSSDHVAN